MKKKFITMALVAGMVLSMTACGNKTVVESSAASESSVTASSEAESASANIQEEVVGTNLTFMGYNKKGAECKTSVPIDEKGYTIQCRYSPVVGEAKMKDAKAVAVGGAANYLFVPEGVYAATFVPANARGNEGCDAHGEFIFATVAKGFSENFKADKSFEECEGAFLSITFSYNGECKEEYADDFLQLVSDMLSSGIAEVSTMSDVTFKKDDFSVADGYGFVSPDAINEY